MSESEKMLIYKSQQGDIESFELLIKEHQKLAFNVAYRILGHMEDAKDATQDAFIKIFKSIKDFKGESNFSTWMYRIVTNTSLDQLRKRKNQNIYSYDHPIDTHEGEIQRNLPDVNTSTEGIVEKRELQRNVQKAINNLPEQHKVVIVLRDIKGFSYEQISEILDCPQGTVKSRISRARNELKIMLQKNMEPKSNGYVKI